MRALALTALLVAGCAIETGILVGVSGSSVDELVFQVGVAEGEDFVLDLAASGQTRDVRGRDLRLDPYELLLRPEDPEAPPAQLRVLVLGQRGGKVVSFAVTEPPQGFLVGEVLRRGLVLQGVSGSLSAGPLGKCFTARPTEKASFRLIARGDRDCDGVGAEDTPPDCNDADSTIRPGAKELCDGKDNDCDQQFFKGISTCYKLISAAVPCREGQRACSESAGNPGATSCEATESSPAVPRTSCGAKAESREASCTVEATGPATARALCPGSIALERQPPPAEPCTWTLVSDGGWPLSLGGSKAPVAVQGCKPTLAVGDGAGTTANLTVIRATFEAKPVTTCTGTPIVCTGS